MVAAVTGNGNESDAYGVASRLLTLVLERHAEEAEDSFEAVIRRLTPSYTAERQQQQVQTERLIEMLQQYEKSSSAAAVDGGGWFGSMTKKQNAAPPHTYDVMDSLVSAKGFFRTLYWYTPNDPDAPPPIWEQTSLKASNVKGQHYYVRNDDLQLAVINYSEIWGRSVYLTAEGTLAPIKNGYIEDDDISNDKKSNTKAMTKRNVASVRNNNKSRSLRRTCPDVFRVDATKVTLHVLGAELQLPIRGSSNLVVVYADPRLRIFVSPMESQSIVGNWEEAGLVVVQVRSELVAASNDDALVDLR